MKKHNFHQAIFTKSAHSLTKLRMAKGAIGLGIYMCVLEALYDESLAMLPKEYDVIAFRFGLNEDEVRAIVEDFDLFEFTEDGKFYCEMLLEERKPKQKKKTTSQATVNNNDESPKSAETEEIYPTSISGTTYADILRKDKPWLEKTMANFGLSDANEFLDYLDDYNCACAENGLTHHDLTDFRNSFLLWLSPLLNQSA